MCAETPRGGGFRNTPPSGRDRERAVAALAAAQGGAIERGQLLALGLGPRGIESRVRDGRLHPRGRGVYTVGHPGLGVDGHLRAALLAAGPDAVLSHRTAAAVWDLRPASHRAVDVTVAGSHRRSDQDLHVHRPRHLDPHDVTEHRGLPLTTVARTLLDLAEVAAPSLPRAIERALILRRYDAMEVKNVLDRANGRRGAPVLAAATADLVDTPPLTRSQLERRFLAVCGRHGLPPPQTNVWLAELDLEVDALWPDARLVVELDSRRFHATAFAFERDRRKDRALTLTGYRVVRVTEVQLEREAASVAADLRVLLGLQARRPP